jgi:hypothetical protein
MCFFHRLGPTSIAGRILPKRVFQNSADTEFRLFFSIQYMPYTIRNCPKFRGIMRNFAEFRDFWCNEIPHNFNSFTFTGQASMIGWGGGGCEMAQFKETVLQGFLTLFFFIKQLLVPLDIRILNFFDFFFFQEVIRICNRLPGVFTTGES